MQYILRYYVLFVDVMNLPNVCCADPECTFWFSRTDSKRQQFPLPLLPTHVCKPYIILSRYLFVVVYSRFSVRKNITKSQQPYWTSYKTRVDTQNQTKHFLGRYIWFLIPHSSTMYEFHSVPWKKYFDRLLCELELLKLLYYSRSVNIQNKYDIDNNSTVTQVNVRSLLDVNLIVR